MNGKVYMFVIKINVFNLTKVGILCVKINKSRIKLMHLDDIGIILRANFKFLIALITVCTI